MRPEHAQLLREQFPELVPQNIRFECGDGWYAVLQKLLLDIAMHAVASGLNPTVVSVREKYGSLRVHLNEDYPHIRDLLLDAENASEKICDICGGPGTLIDDGFWITTRCPTHRRT